MMFLHFYCATGDTAVAHSRDGSVWITAKDSNGTEAVVFLESTECRQIVNKIAEVHPEAFVDQQMKWLGEQSTRTLATIDRVFGTPIAKANDPVSAVIAAMEPTKV